MKIPLSLVAVTLLAAIATPGCGNGEAAIGSRRAPASITDKSNVSNPLKVVGEKGKPRLADRRSVGARKLGR